MPFYVVILIFVVTETMIPRPLLKYAFESTTSINLPMSNPCFLE